MQNLDKLKEAIVADYVRWYSIRDDMDERALKYREESIESFRNGLDFDIGKKYIRVVTKSGSQKSVWGFIVNVHDDKKFKYGDLLKSASWKTPAKNQARGNLIDGDLSKVRWTGLEYLR